MSVTAGPPEIYHNAKSHPATVAIRKGDLPRALGCMEQAFASIRNHDLPSVAWRLHASGARLQNQMGDFAKTEHHSVEAASCLSRAAASFGGNDPLRRSLLKAAETLKIAADR